MKHSNLNTADKLHYAKARTFTGDPAVIAPDFADQILITPDTKEIYLATGTNAGDLTKLAISPNIPVSSVATEWISFEGNITAEAGKSYLKTGSADVFVTLPPSPTNGQSINFFVLFNYLNINSSERPFSNGLGGEDIASPWIDQGYLTRHFPLNQLCQLTFLDGRWYTIVGSLSVRVYTPIFGCTDPSATNYNPNANSDDGSCSY